MCAYLRVKRQVQIIGAQGEKRERRDRKKSKEKSEQGEKDTANKQHGVREKNDEVHARAHKKV